MQFRQVALEGCRKSSSALKGTRFRFPAPPIDWTSRGMCQTQLVCFLRRSILRRVVARNILAAVGFAVVLGRFELACSRKAHSQRHQSWRSKHGYPKHTHFTR